MLGNKIVKEINSSLNGKITVVKSLIFGTYIQAGGLTQSGGIVKEIWEKTLKKIRNHKSDVKNCLILGFGGGSAAKEVKGFWQEAKITGVEIDPVMLSLGKKYLGWGNYDFDIRIKDAYKYCLNLKTRSDLILIDLYIGDKFPDKFGSEKFLKRVRFLLKPKGIAVFNRLYYGEKRPQALKFGNRLEKVFNKVEVFFPEANIMFLGFK